MLPSDDGDWQMAISGARREGLISAGG